MRRTPASEASPSRRLRGRAQPHWASPARNTRALPVMLGFLLAALHVAGLATLTHTPSPMGFLNTLLERPVRERPYLLLVVGYPAVEARVPAITKKPLDAFVSWK